MAHRIRRWKGYGNPPHIYEYDQDVATIEESVCILCGMRGIDSNSKLLYNCKGVRDEEEGGAQSGNTGSVLPQHSDKVGCPPWE